MLKKFNFNIKPKNQFINNKNKSNMKKIVIPFVLLLISTNVKAQSWQLGLNSVQSLTAQFGLSSNTSLDFHTNNTLRMTLTNLGDLRILSLANANNCLIKADNTGRLFTMATTGNANQVLLGTGNWGNLPGGAGSFSINVNNDVVLPFGQKLGIGNNTPNYELEVNGNIRASRNLIVDSAIKFGNPSQFELAFTPGNATTPGNFSFGKFSGEVLPNIPSICDPSDGIPPTTFQYGGLMQLFYQNNNTYSGGPILQMGSTMTKAFIFSRYAPLFINSDCGSDVNICSGGIGQVGIGVLSNANTRLAVEAKDIGFSVKTIHNVDYKYNTQLTVNRDNAKVITAINTANNPNGDENFIVYGDGSTRIGGDYITQNSNLYKLSVNGKIIAEEVVIQLRPQWPDYVFSKNYKLTPLNQVEDFIYKNSHLPNIPSAKEIKDNGLQAGDILSKQMEKIEELTLYLIDLKKDVERLKRENAELQIKIK